MAKLTEAQERAKWQAEDDLRTLQRAAEIQKDKTRVAGAAKLANEQIKSLSTVAKAPARKTITLKKK